MVRTHLSRRTLQTGNHHQQNNLFLGLMAITAIGLAQLRSNWCVQGKRTGGAFVVVRHVSLSPGIRTIMWFHSPAYPDGHGRARTTPAGEIFRR